MFRNKISGVSNKGPLVIDVAKTWAEYQRFHTDWERKVAAEAEVIRSVKPDLVFSNISHLSIQAGSQAKYPVVALSSLSWDQVLEVYTTIGDGAQRAILKQIRKSYHAADIMIRIQPGIPMVAFKKVVDVGPIHFPSPYEPGGVKKCLGMTPDERLVLVAFGGVPLESLPFDRLEDLPSYRFLVGGSQIPSGLTNVSSTASLQVPFSRIMAEADIVITKPGYATMIDAAKNAIPIIYVRRHNFVDEQLIVNFCHQYGRAVELSISEFQAGDWKKALEAVQAVPFPSEPFPESGVPAAAALLSKFF